MFPYQPKPWHLITVSLPLFAIGTLAISMGDVKLDKTEPWEMFGWILLFMGFLSIGMIALSLIWNNASEHNKSKQYMMDSAKHLTLDQMAAIGLIVGDPQKTTNIRITETDRYGNFKSELRIPDCPISPVKMQAVAKAIINDNAPFSRPEISTKRGILSDTEFRKLKKVLEDKNLLIKKNDDSDTAGSVLTPIGRKTFQSYVLPSPTPTLDEAQNG